MSDIVADGVWCSECEYFEEPDNSEDGFCLACGCPTETHKDAQVVTL